MPLREKYENLDADESIFFARQLEHVKAKTYDIKYPELKARALFPISRDAGPGAESIKYEQYSQVGMAKLIANYADDLPRADIGAKEFIANVKSLGIAYGWNIQEIRAAKMAGKPLTIRKAAATKRGMMAKENSIAWFGDTDHNLQGFLSNTNVNIVTLLADGQTSGTDFVDKLAATGGADKIIRDLNLLFTTVHANSMGVEVADLLLLPLSQYNLIFNNPRSTQSDMTIGKFFLENNPHVKSIEWANELAGAGSGSTDVMVAYNRNPEKLTLEVPSDFEQLPVQEKGLEFLVPTHQRIGGVIIYYPLSIAKAEGI